MKKILAILIVALSAALVITAGLYKKAQESLEIAMANVKAYDERLSSVSNSNVAFRLTIDQLKHYQDSVLVELNNVRKELGIKDKKLKALQQISSSFARTDTVVLKDTIFKNPSLSIDTVIGDEWYKAYLGLRYPSKVVISPEFKSEKYVIVSSKKETVNHPKKFFLLRWFQKKHVVLNIDVVEKNPYVRSENSNYVEIIK